MTQRKGWFWDIVEGRVPKPPDLETLSWHLLALDADAGTIQVSFDAGPHLRDAFGIIQGGFVAAMLDCAMAQALAATLEQNGFAPVLDMNVSFIAPARGGRFVATGRIVQKEPAIAFLAGDLRDEDDQLVAAATSTLRIMLGE